MKYLIPVLATIFVLFPVIAHASIILIRCGSLPEYTSKLCYLLEDIQKILYGLSLGIAVIVIIVGGVTYMTAGNDEEKTKRAKKIITNGVIGFAIVLAFSFILGMVMEIIENSLGV
ncbi:pilin [Patescibacteria group bacterium]|nr:pilin [Patescibacteria group bacterium]MBU4458661.1 pilin [Patescibacteria group bacterium]MCG2696020.1 pilin [Candidatus Portnoybacteria bacterium]